MHTFWHDLALGESKELLANLGIGLSVRSAVAFGLHDTGHQVNLPSAPGVDYVRNHQKPSKTIKNCQPLCML